MWTKYSLCYKRHSTKQIKHYTDYMLVFYLKWELIKHIFTIQIQEVLKLNKELKQV